MPSPSKSPDLNPIEHHWDELHRHVRQRQPPPQWLGKLRQELQHEWQRIPHIWIQHIIRSLPRRCRPVLAAHGGHNRYWHECHRPNLSFLNGVFWREGRGFSIFVQYHVGDSYVNCELNITKHCCKESTLSTQNKILKNKHYAFPSKT